MRVWVPPPPIVAPHLRSMAAERDSQVSSELALPLSRVGCPPLFTVAPKGEDRANPRASRPACLPALKYMGRLDCHRAAGTAVEEDEDEEMKEDEEDVSSPPKGGGGGGRLLARPWGW